MTEQETDTYKPGGLIEIESWCPVCFSTLILSYPSDEMGAIGLWTKYVDGLEVVCDDCIADIQKLCHEYGLGASHYHQLLGDLRTGDALAGAIIKGYQSLIKTTEQRGDQ